MTPRASFTCVDVFSLRETAASLPSKRAPFGYSDEDLAALPDAANIGFG